MALGIPSNTSKSVAMTAVFAALAVVLDSVPMIPGFYSGVWDSWLFVLAPLIGVVLGPVTGGISVGIGSLLGHVLYPRDLTELLFMLGAPLGASIAGLVYQRRWRPVLGIYTFLLLGYFKDPVARALPLFGIWDVLLGLCLVLVFALTAHVYPRALDKDAVLLALAVVIGLESDILYRVFVLVPCQAYSLFYGWTPADLQLLWLGAGLVTPVKVAISALVTFAIGLPLLRALPAVHQPVNPTWQYDHDSPGSGAPSSANP
jgi:hypothetical protein